MGEVAHLMDAVHAKSVVVILDCCHSGHVVSREGTIALSPLRDMAIKPTVFEKLTGKIDSSLRRAGMAKSRSRPLNSSTGCSPITCCAEFAALQIGIGTEWSASRNCLTMSRGRSHAMPETGSNPSRIPGSTGHGRTRYTSLHRNADPKSKPRRVLASARFGMSSDPTERWPSSNGN